MDITTNDLLESSTDKIITTKQVTQATKRYAYSKTKDMNKLFKYAEKLKVKSKVLRYMEILL